MGADTVVLLEPSVDDHLCLFCGVEPLCILDFAALSTIEAFIVAVLPRLPGIDLDGLDLDFSQPILQRCRDKF